MYLQKCFFCLKHWDQLRLGGNVTKLSGLLSSLPSPSIHPCRMSPARPAFTICDAHIAALRRWRRKLKRHYGYRIFGWRRSTVHSRQSISVHRSIISTRALEKWNCDSWIVKPPHIDFITSDEVFSSKMLKNKLPDLKLLMLLSYLLLLYDIKSC